MRDRTHRSGAIVAMALATLIAACAPSSLVDVQTSSTLTDPSQIATAAGAAQLRATAVMQMSLALTYDCGYDIICTSGLFTDELSATAYAPSGIDERTWISLPDLGTSGGSQFVYRNIHLARIKAQQARQALRLYAPSSPRAWQGQLYALEGYAVLYLAELFCSGVPLTSVPLVGTPQATRGFSTRELYTNAIALFDSAIVAGADSVPFVNFAKVGKGRALLGMGEFAAAATAVHDVPTEFVYAAQYTSAGSNYANGLSARPDPFYRAQDQEGGTSVVWSTDPRTVIVTEPDYTGDMLRPSKYYVTASGVVDPITPRFDSPVRMADGLEARLIEAEAALAAHDASWLTTLNMLRATCVESAACAPVPGLTAAALPALADPGDDSTRLDLIMTERAMWLYMTGHREGDLRRLAHVYQRDPARLWPTGPYQSPDFPPDIPDVGQFDGTVYGQDVVFVPAPDEQANNSLYSGCDNMNP